MSVILFSQEDILKLFHGIVSLPESAYSLITDKEELAEVMDVMESGHLSRYGDLNDPAFKQKGNFFGGLYGLRGGAWGHDPGFGPPFHPDIGGYPGPDVFQCQVQAGTPQDSGWQRPEARYG